MTRGVMENESIQKKSLVYVFPKHHSEKLFLPNTCFKTAIISSQVSNLKKWH